MSRLTFQRSLTVAALRAGVQQSQPLGKKEDRGPLVEKPVGGRVSKLDAVKRELKIGTGVIVPVAPEVWAYEVSGKQVLRQWFSYRKKNREKPQIGDRRPPLALGEIQPDHWLPEYTTELLNVINVLGLLVKLEPAQAALLDDIVNSPLIQASKFMS
jgi:Type ISP C-terminal specificity domain